MSRGATRNAWAIFRWPLLLALVSVSGLLSALLADGAADVVFWLLLGSLVAILVIACRRASCGR